MPKKLFKRFIPTPAAVKKHRSLGFLSHLLHDPYLFHLNKHSVSLAALVGVFCAFLPIPGQMPVAAAIALWVRCNLPISIALVWISNPLTIPPIFFATYKFGSWILQTPPMESTIALSWEWLTQDFVHIWQPLLVGSLITAVVFSLLSYVAVQLFWRWHVVSQWRKRRQDRAQSRKRH